MSVPLVTRATWLFYAAALVLVALIYRDFGFGFDEIWHAHVARVNFAYLWSGDRTLLTDVNYRYYGPFFDALSFALLSAWWPDDPVRFFLAKHFMTAIVGLLTAVGVHRLTRLLSDELPAWAPLAAGATVLLMPRFFGDMFHNPKDIPFACAFVWASVFCAQALRAPSPWNFVLAGVTTGLCIDIRIGAILLLPAFFAPLATTGIRAWLAGRREAARAIGLGVGAFLGVCLLVVYAFWPYLWASPFVRAAKAFRAMRKVPWLRSVLFDGRETMAQDLPWYYLGKWLLISVPEWMLVCAVIGLVGCLLRPRLADRRVLAFVLVAFALSFLAFSRPGRTIYDGARHFLFGQTLIPIFAAVGLSILVAARRWLAWPAGAAVALLVAVNLYDLISYHPYQSLYFNRSYGGLPGAYGRQETDYWALSYRAAATWMNQHVAGPATVRFWGNDYYEMLLDREKFTVARGREKADYYVSVTRWNRHEVPGSIVHVVTFKGVPLCFVIRPS